MASVALSLVGTAIAGPIGGAVGGIIGGMIDNVLIGQNRPQPPAITTSTYGNAIPLVFGPYVRLGCNMIFTSGWKKEGGKNGKMAEAKGAPPPYHADLAFYVGETMQPNWLVKLFANGTCIFDATIATSIPAPDANGVVTWSQIHNSHRDFDSITVYPGNYTQLPDPTIEGKLGTGNVCPYRGTAYFVIAGLQGTPFGNSVPVLNALVCAQSECTLATVAGAIAARANIDTNKMSTSSLTRQIAGYAVKSQMDGYTALQPLALVYDFDIAEVAGQLRMLPRGTDPLCTILNDQLAGHAAGAQRPEFEWPREGETTLPQTAAVTFKDTARDCNDNTQSAQREVGTSTANLSQSVDVSETSDHMRGVADRMLWEAQLGRQSLSAATDERLAFLEPARNYCIETPAGYEPIRLTKKAEGADNVIQIEGKRDMSSLYFSNAPGADANVLANGVNIGGPVNAPIFVEVPSSFPGVTRPTLFIGLSGDPDVWAGCAVYWSLDDVTDDYVLAPNGYVNGPACMGVSTAPYPAFGGSNPDSAHTLNLDLSESGGEIASVTSTNASLALTPCWFDGEYISPETVVDTGANTFACDPTFRRMYGSNADAHATDKPFLRLDSACFQFAMNVAFVGASPKTLYFRFVSGGETIADAVTYSYTPNGNGYGTGPGGAPSAPAISSASGLVGSAIGQVQAASADDNVDTIAVYRNPGPGGATTGGTLVDTVGPGQQFSDPTAAPATTYTYYSTATNAVGTSASSAGVDVTTPAVAFTGPVTITGNLKVTGTIEEDTGT